MEAASFGRLDQMLRTTLFFGGGGGALGAQSPPAKNWGVWGLWAAARPSQNRKKQKTFFIFHLNSMKIGEVVVINVFKNFTKIHSYLNEKQKSFLMKHLTDAPSIRAGEFGLRF